MKNFNNKKLNNMFNLDSFTEIKNPVRGEVQDTGMVPAPQPIDRYNPAQPYIPEYGVGAKAKKPSPAPSKPAPPPRPPPSRPAPPPPSPPVKAVANLVPPPPPQAPKLTADDFPTPSTYDSFPPYDLGGPGSGPSFSFPPTGDSGSDSSGDDGPPSGPPSGYRYQPPAPPSDSGPPAPAPPSFVPTLPPLSKPFAGYSYNKPPMESDADTSSMDMDDKPNFQGYQYNKPAPPPEPSPPHDHPSPSYGHHDAPPPSYHPESDYPELIFDKPHGGMDHGHGGDAMKVNDMGMMPPPPPAAAAPDVGPAPDDHGFPHDFPGDFKYAHDFDEHDYHHYHHHHPTTTTTTTEMPRVNRYSYYYLGKKLYYLPLYFSVYFVVYVGALIIKAVLRHKITYPNSFRPNDNTATFFSKRSVESHLSNENLHEITGRVTKAIASAAEKYISEKSKEQ
ncbi:uncharacterized protein LOC142975725 [Anticarsia gemmatalis]|uniref:uncharacterized protein LOC142975725 n=1 Tax=Anticarsia gemmatalis TaxID=129554 RepID=UPI003F76621C